MPVNQRRYLREFLVSLYSIEASAFFFFVLLNMYASRHCGIGNKRGFAEGSLVKLCNSGIVRLTNICMSDIVTNICMSDMYTFVTTATSSR